MKISLGIATYEFGYTKITLFDDGDLYSCVQHAMYLDL